MMKKLAIITTHPIQYNAPVFRLLHERQRIESQAFYTWGAAVLQDKYDPGFDRTIVWDLPLLEGYNHVFANNVSTEPGSHHFNGIDNPGLIQAIEAYAPDAVLVFGWSFKSHLKIIRHFKGKVKVLFRGDSTLLDEDGNFSVKQLVRPFFLRWVYRFVDVALYAGSANKAYFLQYGLRNEQLVFAPHAVENDRFAKEVVPYPLAGIPSKAIVFLFAGKFIPKKDPLLLLEAFISLDDPDAYLVMVGNGVLEPTMMERITVLPRGLRERIHFVPFQNQSVMPAVYQLADVFVLPSQGPGETWGLAVNEAMACGKAVIVSDKCGCSADLVKPGMNGYSFGSGNRDELLSILQGAMLEGKDGLRRMGDASREIIDEWTFEKVACSVEQVVLSC